MAERHVYDMIVVGGGPGGIPQPSMGPEPGWIPWCWNSFPLAARWH